jgi:hypothetical protein
MNNSENNCYDCLYYQIDSDCRGIEPCSNFKPKDSWDRVAEPHQSCRPITTKKVKIAPGLVLWCNRGKNMLLIESNGMAGAVDLSRCENQEAVDAWIRDTEEQTLTYQEVLEVK